uniref:TF-B3 domain-containing protein n=2 Tax=Chenopodium quinoa TaxID=63459 RepID=A0A803KW41_CHEQI
MSACEIEYPIHSEACREIPPMMKKIIDITNKSSSLEKVKAMRTNVDAKLIIARDTSLTSKEDKKVRAYAQQRKQPLFVIRIQPSFVVKNFSMGIPKEFAKRYLDKKRPFNLTFNLQIDASKTWPVLVDGDYTHVKFRKGWKDIALENKLKVGDICIFELIKKHLFQVHIIRVFYEKIAENLVFKTEEESNYPLTTKACRESPPKKRKTNENTKPCSSVKGMQTSMDDKLTIANKRNCKLTPEEYKRIRAYAHQCKHPVFVTKMQPSFIGYNYCVGVPKTFRMRYLDKKERFSHRFNLRTNSGKTWPVTIVASNTHARLKTGWKTFALDNKLNVDDTCIFELINQQEFKVSILRVANAKGNRENPAVKCEV